LHRQSLDAWQKENDWEIEAWRTKSFIAEFRDAHTYRIKVIARAEGDIPPGFTLARVDFMSGTKHVDFEYIRIYHDSYDTTIEAYCYSEDSDQAVNITQDGVPTGETTPHTFTGLVGPHLFTVDAADTVGHVFKEWSTGSPSDTLGTISDGEYTAYYGELPPLRTLTVAPNVSRGSGISLDRQGLPPPPLQTGCLLASYDFDSGTDGWISHDLSDRGDFASLYPGISQVQEDRDQFNFTVLWAFLNGSAENYACAGYPAQTAVPFGLPCLMNEIWSPKISWNCEWPCTNAELRFDVYRDLSFNPLVFYVWHVRSWQGGTPGPWRDRNLIYYGGGKDWFRAVHEFGDLVEEGADDIQVALGVWDMFGSLWSGCYALDDCRSHAPLFDNVEVHRLYTTGPRWGVRGIDLFQDNFPDDGTDAGTARADMALDINRCADLDIRPGDSVCVWVGDPVNGLSDGPNTCGTAVYCYVSPSAQNHDAFEIEADEAGLCLGINGLPVRFPAIDSVNTAGRLWYRVQMDTCFTDDDRQGAIPGRYCVDLNDGLFTPRDTIFFFFGAENSLGEFSYWSEFTGSTPDFNEAAGDPMEFQILPTGESDILYVDKYDGWGAQPLFDTAFKFLGITPDRYDVRGPTSLAGNSLAGRVKSYSNQLIPNYRKIIWNTGDVSVGTIGDGSGNPCKEDDFYLLYSYLYEYTDTTCGIYFSGDDIAEEWAGLTGYYVLPLMNNFMFFTLVDGDHRAALDNGRLSPLVVADATSQVGFYHGGNQDSIAAYGGYPYPADFDVITPTTGDATIEMSYKGAAADQPAVLAQQRANSPEHYSRVVLSGFSYHHLYDDRPSGIPDRVHHLQDILLWFENAVNDPVGAVETPRYANRLAQNYPNPFNPSTTIEYSIAAPSPVTLKIYNVVGQLVKTLVADEMQYPAPVVKKVVWDGRNNSGQQASNGVYFYRLVTKDFVKTRKMVLLK
jgi:hypothetical protein